MKTMYIIVTFVAFICCGMLAIVCAITMAKAIVSKDEADEKSKTTR